MPEDKYNRPEELARILDVSTATVLNLLKRGCIQGIRVGKQWRIPESELRRVLAEGVRAPSEV